jgi:hypothetical protein
MGQGCERSVLYPGRFSPSYLLIVSWLELSAWSEALKK